MKKFSNFFVFALILIAFLGTSILVGCKNPWMPDLPDNPDIEDPSGSEGGSGSEGEDITANGGINIDFN